MKFLLLLVLLAFQAVASDIHICYVSDDNYALPTRVSLNSLLKHSDPSDHLNIHIVDFGIAQENKFAIENLKSVRDFNLDFTTFDISKCDNLELREYYGGYGTYGRLYLSDIFPSLDRLIFLDGDTIVENSFKNLWKTELGDNYWAGADHNGYYSFPHSLNHCAAVMLLNLKKFREENKKLEDDKLNVPVKEVKDLSDDSSLIEEVEKEVEKPKKRTVRKPAAKKEVKSEE